MQRICWIKCRQRGPGGTKPMLWFTGKKLRKKCSDLMAAFTGLPLGGKHTEPGSSQNANPSKSSPLPLQLSSTVHYVPRLRSKKVLKTLQSWSESEERSLKVCDRSHRTTSGATSSTNFTNQVLFTSSLNLESNHWFIHWNCPSFSNKLKPFSCSGSCSSRLWLDTHHIFSIWASWEKAQDLFLR